MGYGACLSLKYQNVFIQKVIFKTFANENCLLLSDPLVSFRMGRPMNEVLTGVG